MTETKKSKREPHYINSNVAFVNHHVLIQDAVQEMINRGISSILVEDDDANIVGIVTERDIVRKFTMIELEDKLTRTVGTIMTRPIEFVQLKNFHQQIVKLHLEKRIRHFPILSAKEPIKENLVGIVSITDVARNYMMNEMKKTKTAEPPTQSEKKVVGVVAKNRGLVNNYIEIFNNLGFSTQEVSNLNQFAADPAAEKKALIVDLDGFNDQEIHTTIPIAVKSKVHLILTTSQPSLIPIFKKYIDKSHQEIASKPIDISYICWLLQSRWDIGGH